MHQLVLSKKKLGTIKPMMQSKCFPNSNELNEARKKLRPTVCSVMDGTNVYANYIDLIKDTTISILTSLYDQGISIDKFFCLTVLERYM